MSLLMLKLTRFITNNFYGSNYSELDHNSFSKEEEILTFRNVLVDKIEIYFNN